MVMNVVVRSGVVKLLNLTRVSRRKRDAFRVLGFLISLGRYEKRSAFPQGKYGAKMVDGDWSKTGNAMRFC
jgi:hypothetical protein